MQLKDAHLEQLRDLYEVILNLASEPARVHMQLFRSEDAFEFHEELTTRVEALIEATVPLNPGAHPYDLRANCPLCGGESMSRYEVGFAYPEGLRRHMLTGGNVNRCEVTKLLSKINSGMRTKTDT